MVKKYKKTGKVGNAVKKYVKKALDSNVEDKSLVLSPLSLFGTVHNTYTDVDVSDTSQGITGQQHVGRKVRIKSFKLTGTLQGGQVNSAGDDKINTFRIVLATWVGNTTAPLSTIGISVPVEHSLGTTAMSLLKHKYVDQTFVLESSGRDSTGYMPAVRNVTISRRFKRPIVINYATDATTSKNNTLVLSMVSDSSVSPSPGFTLGSIVIRYEDA